LFGQEEPEIILLKKAPEIQLRDVKILTPSVSQNSHLETILLLPHHMLRIVLGVKSSRNHTSHCFVMIICRADEDNLSMSGETVIMTTDTESQS
jgi:hypothetical protein